jgi:Zn-dependent protease with chaperone function
VVRANYFDGHSTRVRVAEISVSGPDLIIVGDGVDLRVPSDQVKVDERLGRASRRLRLPDGAFCEVRDLAGLDFLLSTTMHRDGFVDRLQRRARWVVAALLACAMVVAALYRWGLPWAAAVTARRLPMAVGDTITIQSMKILDGGLLAPSKLPVVHRKALNEAFRALRLPGGGAPHSDLAYRASPQLGANAFTLPNGTIIVLDDLVDAVADDRRILAVLAHELGHAVNHHSMQLLLRSSAVGAFWTFYVGDISQLLAAAPATLVEASYSQEFEREADDYAAAVLIHNGMSPGLLADALTKLAERHPGSGNGGYLSSHPSNDERLRRLRQLAGSSAEATGD